MVTSSFQMAKLSFSMATSNGNDGVIVLPPYTSVTCVTEWKQIPYFTESSLGNKMRPDQCPSQQMSLFCQISVGQFNLSPALRQSIPPRLTPARAHQSPPPSLPAAVYAVHAAPTPPSLPASAYMLHPLSSHSRGRQRAVLPPSPRSPFMPATHPDCQSHVRHRSRLATIAVFVGPSEPKILLPLFKTLSPFNTLMWPAGNCRRVRTAQKRRAPVRSTHFESEVQPLLDRGMYRRRIFSYNVTYFILSHHPHQVSRDNPATNETQSG